MSELYPLVIAFLFIIALFEFAIIRKFENEIRSIRKRSRSRRKDDYRRRDDWRIH
jgi:hypothetical protein